MILFKDCFTKCGLLRAVLATNPEKNRLGVFWVVTLFAIFFVSGGFERGVCQRTSKKLSEQRWKTGGGFFLFGGSAVVPPFLQRNRPIRGKYLRRWRILTNSLQMRKCKFGGFPEVWWSPSGEMTKIAVK